MATGNGQVNDSRKPEATDTNLTDSDENLHEPAKNQEPLENGEASNLPIDETNDNSADDDDNNNDTEASANQVSSNLKTSAILVKEKALEIHEKVQQRRVAVIFSILAAFLAVVIIVAGGYAVWNGKYGEQRNYQQLQELAQKPKGMTKDGGLPAFKASDYNPKAPKIDLYVDYFCPGCAIVEQDLFRSMKDMMEAKQINLYLHPINFLDSKTKNHYSTRAASAVAYVASNQPGKLFDFSTALFDKTYQPNKDNNRDVSNQEIIDQAVKAGVKESIAKNSVKGTYTDYVDKATKYTSRRKELYVTMQDQFRFSTPTICINGKMWQYRQLHTLDDVRPTFIHSIGLHREQVGDPKTLPAIGPDGDAIPIQQKYL
ncbi:thioredoxin domain-containing protein [Bifidobacterium sp. ESL0732]|uniref:DsbA family protein n=1 Tax=Bifidobacterium sp. ESL0732 TaxID=2983222 RepID=UPI0023F9058C|nr:thioredoxin domain-containing protein [Bifidobacterium sp. ESL0732]WEV63481.1 thioredoxin domain-containing protein [Bifidobacterium sp. ESL0732]